MSYESAVTALKALVKLPLVETDPHEHYHIVRAESDRASIILCAAMVEEFLVCALMCQMETINSDERARIFAFEGPCGSFSSRIRMAQALGLIDRKMRRRVDLLRELRNVAAHAHPHVTFALPEIRNAVVTLFDPSERSGIAKLSPAELRRQFEKLCGALNYIIMESFPKPELSQTSPGKSRRPSPLGHPAKARKGKQPPPQRKSSPK